MEEWQSVQIQGYKQYTLKCSKYLYLPHFEKRFDKGTVSLSKPRVVNTDSK